MPFPGGRERARRDVDLFSNDGYGRSSHACVCSPIVRYQCSEHSVYLALRNLETLASNFTNVLPACDYHTLY